MFYSKDLAFGNSFCYTVSEVMPSGRFRRQGIMLAFKKCH